MIWPAIIDVMGRPWRWGEADCCASACSVFARLHGVDPMGPLRGAYHSEAGARRLIREQGGLDAMAARMAAASGLTPSSGEPGAIGCVEQEDGSHALVICAVAEPEPMWIGKTLRGFGPASGRLVGGWTVAA